MLLHSAKLVSKRDGLRSTTRSEPLSERTARLDSRNEMQKEWLESRERSERCERVAALRQEEVRIHLQSAPGAEPSDLIARPRLSNWPPLLPATFSLVYLTLFSLFLSATLSRNTATNKAPELHHKQRSAQNCRRLAGSETCKTRYPVKSNLLQHRLCQILRACRCTCRYCSRYETRALTRQRGR